MAEKLIEVKHLKKYFTTRKGQLHAVDDASFHILKGETLGLVGESGCGKSTTGRVLIRLIEPTSGEILFDGKDVVHAKGEAFAELRRNMQIVFQDPYSSLDPRKSVYESIEEPIRVNGLMHDPAERRRYIYALMDTVGLARRFSGAYPHEMDGGRRQRVGIARALALKPKFIVLDEPVSALDVSIQAQILNLMQQLQKSAGLTYLFISHDLSVVKHISDRIAVMYLGMIVELASYKDIFRSPKHPYTQALLSAVPIPNIDVERKQIILTGDVPSPINPAPGCRFYNRCPVRQEICRESTPELVNYGEEHYCACHLLQKAAQE